jgi:predicted Zn-dependent protease with MMP-like domain
LGATKFEELVAQALDSLPEWVREHLDNVEVLTASWPSPSQLATAGIGRGALLLGLYEGVPLTKRGRGYNLVPPDRITLFQGPLELQALDDKSLIQAIRRTIIHEIAHHFGFSEEHLDKLNC